MAFDVMALGIPLRLEGTQEAIAGLTRVDAAGQQAAKNLTVSMSQASQALTALGISAKTTAINGIDRIIVSEQQLTQANQILKNVGAGTFTAIAAEAQKAAGAIDKVMLREMATADRFQQQKAREIAGAERSAHAQEQAYRRVAVAAQRAAQQQTADAQRVATETERSAVRQQAAAEKTATTMGRRYSGAALQIAGTLQAITAAGDASAGQVTRLIAAVSGVAFAFGPHGQLVGAVGLATVSIVNMFTRAREEAEKTRKALVALMSHRVGSDAVMQQIEGMRVTIADLRKEVEREGPQFIGTAQIETKKVKALNDAIALEKELTRIFVEKGDIEARLIEHQEKSTAIDVARKKLIEEQNERIKEQIELLRKAWNETVRLVTRPLSEQIAGGGLVTPGAPSPMGVPAGRGANTSLLPIDFDAISAQMQAAAEKAADDAEEALRKFQAKVNAVAFDIASSIGDAIGAGFSAAFSSGSIGEGIKALTASILSSFGGMMKQIGIMALAASAIIRKIATAIASWNPVAAVAASLALIALGSALQAGASSIMSGGGGSSGGGGGGREFRDRMSTTTIAGSGTQNQPVATPIQPITNNITVIGPDDASAQRQIKRLLRNADARGV